ncbi:MAG: glycine cleavage system H protein [Thermoplasmata archaeon]
MKDDFLEYQVDKFIFRVKKGYYYNWNDCWASIEGELATVGITDYIQRQGGDVISVELPNVGRVIEQFEDVITMETVKAVIPVISPVGGEIIEVNKLLEESPELVNEDPYGKGWIYKVRLTDKSELDNLENAEKYFEIMKDKIKKELKK